MEQRPPPGRSLKSHHSFLLFSLPPEKDAADKGQLLQPESWKIRKMCLSFFSHVATRKNLITCGSHHIGASLAGQLVKNLPTMQETQVQFPVCKTHTSILAWRILWTEESGGLQSMGSVHDLPNKPPPPPHHTGQLPSHFSRVQLCVTP